MEHQYKGTQTEKNLMAAFAGESQARNKYTYFASKAKKEGYEQIAALFLQTADNEKEHAKMWFKELCGIGNTAENLAAAADGENYEFLIWNFMILLQIPLCLNRKSGKANPPGHPPMPCPVRYRFRDRRVRDHRRIRRGIHTFSC